MAGLYCERIGSNGGDGRRDGGERGAQAMVTARSRARRVRVVLIVGGLDLENATRKARGTQEGHKCGVI